MATTTTSSSSTLKNVLIVIAVILAMVISFFMGRATAPQNNAASESDGMTQEQATGDPSADEGEKPERQMGADQPKFAESQQDPQIIELLRDQPKREEGDPRAIGAVDAPVVMITYEDFSCPMCTVFFQDTYPELKKLVDDGQLRIEFRDLVIFPNYGSNHAARAARAAGNQEMFWEYVEAAFDSAGAGNHPTYDADVVMALAEEVGIPDMDKFKADYESDEIKEAVDSETQHGMYNLGINGTPFFIVNDAVISGAQPTSFFVNTIERQLEEAK